MKTQEQKLQEKITKLEAMINKLIDNGENMEDAAETCGHDEVLEDWQKTVKKAKKLIDYANRKEEYQKERRERWEAVRKREEEKARAKWEKENAKYREEDEALMKELGIL